MRLLLGALVLAGAFTTGHAEARKARRIDLSPVPVPGAMVDDRYQNLRLPEAYGAARAQRYRKAVAQKRPVVRQTRSRRTPYHARSIGLAGIVPVLAAKAAAIVNSCGSRVISAVRHTNIAGTRRLSLHASGRAVDLAGNPSCIYAALRGWPGGVSVDYARVKHVHISYDPWGRREMGLRFAHGGHRHSVGFYARRHTHRRHYRRRA